MMPMATLEDMSIDDLHAVIKNLLSYKHTISYVGSLSFDEVRSAIENHMKYFNALRDPPDYKHRRVRSCDGIEPHPWDRRPERSSASEPLPFRPATAGRGMPAP